MSGNNMTRRRAALGFISLAASLPLIGCGGGGGNPNSGNNLVVIYSYAGVTTLGTRIALLTPVNLVPQLLNLNGNTPHFSIASGSLPAGLTLNPNTGVISGRPTALMSTKTTIRLTVDGFEGYLDEVVGISVSNFNVYYANANPIGNIDIPITSMLPMAGIGSGLPVSYHIVSGGSDLPPGVSINPQTGDISGTPTTGGGWYVGIGCSVTYNGQVYDAIPQYLNFNIDSTPLFSYPTLRSYLFGDYVNLYPATYGTPTDTYTDFRWAVGTTPPAGMSVDPTNGTVTGQAQGSGLITGIVEVTLHRGSTPRILQAAVSFTVI